MGYNTNVMGYTFPMSTQAMSSLLLLVLSFLFFSYIPQSLVLTLSSFSIQPLVQEHEDLVWLAKNLKLEVTKYSIWIYGPKRFAHAGDDGDGGGDLETTPSFSKGKGVFCDPADG